MESITLIDLGVVRNDRIYPETGLEEINGDLLEADFGPASLNPF